MITINLQLANVFLQFMLSGETWAHKKISHPIWLWCSFLVSSSYVLRAKTLPTVQVIEALVKIIPAITS